MSPDWGHDIPSVTSGLPYPPVRTSSLGHGLPRVINMAEFPVVSIDQTLKGQDPAVSELAALAHNEFSATSTREDHRPVSLRSSSTQTSLSSGQSRRDSGYSSSKQTATKPPRGSRTSSKQSLSSSRDTSTSYDSARRPSRPRLSSISRIQDPKRNVEDAIALHGLSKKLFPTSSPPQSPVVGPQEEHTQPLQRSISSPYSLSRPPSRRMQVTRMQTFNTLPRTSGLRGLNDLDFNKPEDEQAEEQAVVPPPITIHWTSDETRRKEYAQIDKQSRGIRGVWNKIIPKFLRSSSSKFYNEKENSDADSVRRYRLDLPSR